jgi:hypothetical protein
VGTCLIRIKVLRQNLNFQIFFNICNSDVEFVKLIILFCGYFIQKAEL